MTYERPNIAAMTGYVPGEQPASTDVVKLNTNENPYPPCDAVTDALRGVTPEQLRRYPNPTARGFREAAAQVHDLSPDHIIATNGGDELLRLVITTFVEPKGVIGYAEPSYSLYPVLAAVQDAKVYRVPLDESWCPPTDFTQQLRQVEAQLTFIVNPHAPSGRLMPVDALRKIAADVPGVLVIDEAYVDFVDPALDHDAVSLVRDGVDNVILLRSLSKGYSLAGLRFGYGIASPALIAPMQTKTKDSYNTDAVSQALATASMLNRDRASESWAKVRAERGRVTESLEQLGMAVEPSQSNFVLATPGNGNAKQIYESLKAGNIFVRYFDQPRLDDKLRITIGTPAESDALLAALKQM
jgi:histidinol-phosphate aminotransferase